MKKRTIALSVLAAVLLLTATIYSFANAPAKGTMGVWGYVVDSKNASLDVSDQPGADTLVVSRVTAPQAAWLVVHADDNGMPGKRVGLVHIDKGESVDVAVKLTGVKTQKVIVAVHADKGTPGNFEFDMDNKEKSADRPFFVNRKELARIVTVR